MTVAAFIAKNALRNKRRAALTILSVAVSCALLVTLLTLQRELTIPPEAEAASLRVIVRNKVSLAQPLPALAASESGQQKRQFDVFVRGQYGNQVEGFKNKADVLVPPVREFLFVEPGHVDALHDALPVCGAVDARDDVQQLRFA